MFSAKTITKTEEITILLSCPRLPARLTTGETAVLLGFAEHDIPLLISYGLLKPLGKPANNASKYFASTYITHLANDPTWLDRATAALAKHWRGKNRARSSTIETK